MYVGNVATVTFIILHSIHHCAIDYIPIVLSPSVIDSDLTDIHLNENRWRSQIG